MALNKAIPDKPISHKALIQPWKLKLKDVDDGDVVTIKGWHGALVEHLQRNEGKAFAPYRFDKIRFLWRGSDNGILSGEVIPLYISNVEVFNKYVTQNLFVDQYAELNSVIIKNTTSGYIFVSRADNTTTLSASSTDKALTLLIKWFAGCDLITEEIMKKDPDEGGVQSLQDFFSEKHKRLMNEVTIRGAKKLIQLAPTEYESYIEEGQTFENLTSVLDQLMTDKKCQIDEPHLSRFIALYYSIMFEKNLTITSSQRAFQRCISKFLFNWEEQPVNVNEMNKSRSLYRENDVYSPAMAFMLMLNSLLIINDEKAVSRAMALMQQILTEFAQKLQKQVHKIELVDIMTEKDQFYETIDKVTGRTEHFDNGAWLEKYNMEILPQLTKINRAQFNHLDATLTNQDDFQNSQFNVYQPRFQNFKPRIMNNNRPRNFNLRQNNNRPYFPRGQNFANFNRPQFRGPRPSGQRKQRRRPQRPWRPQVLSRRNSYKVVIVPEEYEFSEDELDDSETPLARVIEDFNKFSFSEDPSYIQSVDQPNSENTNYNENAYIQNSEYTNNGNFSENQNLSTETGQAYNNYNNYNDYNNNNHYNNEYYVHQNANTGGYNMSQYDSANPNENYDQLHYNSYSYFMISQKGIPTHSPKFKLHKDTFGSYIKYPPTVIYDTGADRTLIPSFIFHKIKKQYISKIIPVRLTPGIDAQGNSIVLEQMLVNLKFKLESGKISTIEGATVAKFKETNANYKILLGIRDICLNKLELKFECTDHKPTISQGKENLEYHNLENKSSISSVLSDFQPPKDLGNF